MPGTGKFEMVKLDQSLKGLVLAGGRSLRMGESKAKMSWHGKQQQYYLADLLKCCCEEVFISCRIDQAEEIDSKYQSIIDRYPTFGPMEAILSAFEKFPDAAWMIVACDLPLIDEQTLKFLAEERNPAKIATVFENPDDHLPEPLIAIWEPKSFEILKLCLQKQHHSLRKILIGENAKTIKAPDAGALINVNTPADATYVRSILKKRRSV